MSTENSDTAPQATSPIKRRSVSIFSRRGADTPVNGMGPAHMRFMHSSVRHKKWKLQKNPAAQGPAVTVLRAVPKAQPPPAPLTSLEIAMATSPNEEILHNIGQRSPLQDALDFHSLPQFYAFGSTEPITSPASPKRKQKEGKSPDRGEVIGVWKNGKAHWEPGARKESRNKGQRESPTSPQRPVLSQISDASVAELDGKPIDPPRQGSTSPGVAPKARRPRIQVVIPSDQRRKPLASTPQPAAESAMAEVASGSSVSPPSVTGNTRARNSMVSPLVPYQPRPRRPLQAMALPSIEQELDPIPRPKHKPKASISGSSSSSHGESDATSNSNYSNRSSMTSIDLNDVPVGPQLKPVDLVQRSASKAFSIPNPVKAGVFDEASPLDLSQHSEPNPEVETKFRMPPSAHPTPVSASGASETLVGSPSIRSAASSSVKSKRGRSSAIRRRHSSRRTVLSSSRFSMIEKSRLQPQLVAEPCGRPPSPTLSEAADDLANHLTTLSANSPFQWQDVVRAGPPVPPPKSARRSFTAPTNSPATLRTPAAFVVPPPRRRIVSAPLNDARSKKGPQTALKLSIPEECQVRNIQDSNPPARPIAPAEAEKVILKIFQSMNTLSDLFSTAIISQGFYGVFKRNELDLMRHVLKKMSPPAWEHREITPPANVEIDPDSDLPNPEYSPATYYRYYKCDMFIIDAIKSLIFERCQSLLRPETVAALNSQDPADYSRVNDALWRIWTFCKIFGCGKSREDDIVGQMDWLKGGVLVHQETCRATIITSDSLDVSSVLLSAPECFGRGNSGGLSAEELYDMMELWTCLGVLMQGLLGRTEQARQFGVYDTTEVRGGDIDGEEMMLEEWYHYLLSLGLSAILHLATPSADPTPSVFVLANENGWMQWTPPEQGGSRSTFLKEAVSRVYEEKIAATFAETAAEKQRKKEVQRQRIASHAAVIRQRKLSGDCKNIRQSMERPISQWEGVLYQLEMMSPQPSGPSSPHSPHAGRPPSRPNTGYLASPMRHPPFGSHPAFSSPSTQSSGFGSPHSQSTAFTTPPMKGSPFPSPNMRNSAFIPPPPPPPPPKHPHNLTIPPPPSNGPAGLAPPRPRRDTMVSSHPPSFVEGDRRASLASSQHPLQLQMNSPDLADRSSDRAIFRIVEMGFTAEQARNALRMTDLGDGLRIDRAVELLLRQSSS